MLEAAGLSKTYENGVRALVDLRLQVRDGELYCLVGPNGAGKSTTINLFLNYIQPTDGAALVDEISVAQEPLKTRCHLAYIPEQVSLYGPLTARQNITFFARLAGERSGIDYTRILEIAGLEEAVLQRRLQAFSKGMKQRLALAIAVAKGARNLLLDEPTSGLDPRSAADFVNLLMRLRLEGYAILISSHDLFRVQDMADVVGVMSEGRLCAELTSPELSRSDLQKTYMDLVAK